MEKLTKEQIQAKADEISKELNVKVTPIEFIDGEEQIIGFIQEPNRMTKMRSLDKAMQSPVTAASELLEATIIRQHSNPRIMSERSEDDKIYIGAAMCCFELVKVSEDQFKKK